ncbi:MAG: hypothetical protein IPK81_10710 [Rhodospirillales bacterium]|nr:MAG: hypothetical protein IPK81_10710 [Rhodospirillales bacterium]
MIGPVRYDRSAIYADYARAAVGVVVCLVPALFVTRNTVTLCLAALGVLFLTFAARTFIRQTTEITADNDGITAAGTLGGSVPWRTLKVLKLAYYATRKDRKGGWMHLTLAGEGRALRMDSTLERFDDIARLAARAAVANGLELSPATRANFAALDIALPSPSTVNAEAPA